MNSKGRDQGSGVRGQESACGERRRTEGQAGSSSSTPNNRRGMTLVEVLLSAAILGIMAIAATRATFYPRVLAVSSTLKQLAVQAGTGEIERLRADYTYDSMPASFTTNLTAKFNLKGRPISATGTVQEFTASKAGYADYQYKRITVTVDYGATNLTLITYRSP